jgi:Pregnancy-associated plasma protein-A
MKKSMIYGAFSLLMIVLGACRQTPSSQLKSRLEKCGMLPELGYNAYLDKVIAYQDSSKVQKMRELTFTVKVNFVDAETNLMSQAEVDSTMAYLSSVFSDVKIKFKASKQINFIKSDYSVDDIFRDSSKEDSLCEGAYSSKYINLFVMNRSIDVVGYTHYPMLKRQRIFISRKKILDPAIVHEFGHFFGLLHTFEHFGGEEAVKGTNCKIAGDKICDTPADPFGASFLEDDCQLYGKYQNANGEVFKPDMSNYMSYYGKCRHTFTALQAKRMYFIARNVKNELVRN